MNIAVSCGAKNWGGLERMAELLARGLQNRGHQVVLLCRRGSPLHTRVSGEIPCEPILGGSDLDPLVQLRVLSALRRHKPDVVLANTAKDPRWTGPSAKLLGIPYIYRQEIDEPYKRGLYYRWIYGRIPDVHVVNSDATRRTILASARWLDPERVEVIPNGIDPAPFQTAVEPSGLDLPEGSPTFVFLGRFEERKGIRELAAAWPIVVKALPQARLLVGGWGELEDEFRSRLMASPGARFIGFRRDVPAVLSLADVLVAPSHYEGFGLVVVEAMAAGVPVIAAEASSIPEIMRDGVEGLLVPPRDSARLARAMVRLGSAPELRRKMGSAGRERVLREFTFDRMLDRHEELLARLATGRAPSS